MYRIFLMLFLVSAFAACDGRSRAHMSNASVLKEDNLYKSFTEELKFIPEQPVVITTDTLLDSGFRVKLNYHSLENNLLEKRTQNINDSTTFSYYKKFEAHIQVYKNNENIVNTIIENSLFSSFENYLFWENAIMQYLWVDQENSDINGVELKTAFHIPETDIYKDFIIKISESGRIEIEAYPHSPKTI
ncbi:hypothetical protein [Aestuariibaculum sediminum]|uniref:Lipoprotein n=1 Tax=Aestuariibaculum sediminum TaxID=2770637 RepID=A0A8J6UI21_9FLAO|nr:hypothetical protein [Aestuariibaculum sediminum]MBD0833701.1 hypothetical protein [Aestuariibaculum sediminum]